MKRNGLDERKGDLSVRTYICKCRIKIQLIQNAIMAKNWLKPVSCAGIDEELSLWRNGFFSLIKKMIGSSIFNQCMPALAKLEKRVLNLPEKEQTKSYECKLMYAASALFLVNEHYKRKEVSSMTDAEYLSEVLCSISYIQEVNREFPRDYERQADLSTHLISCLEALRIGLEEKTVGKASKPRKKRRLSPLCSLSEPLLVGG